MNLSQCVEARSFTPIGVESRKGMTGPEAEATVPGRRHAKTGVDDCYRSKVSRESGAIQTAHTGFKRVSQRRDVRFWGPLISDVIPVWPLCRCNACGLSQFLPDKLT